MRLFMFPLALLGVLVGGSSDEPSEGQMRQAFEASLSAQVRDVMQFVTETDGPGAVAKIQHAGSDRFAIRSFHKLNCARADGGYVCSFAVDIELSNGDLVRQMDGRFSSGASGLAFTDRV